MPSVKKAEKNSFKFKPCPFCGETKLIDVAFEDLDGSGSAIRCLECCAEGPKARGKDAVKRLEKAIKLWNKRAKCAST